MINGLIKRCGRNSVKNSRFKFEYRKSASKLHKAVGDVLRDSPIFNGYNIYQEYPVNRVNPDYQESSHHFDWVIPEIRLVIEAHGRQHFEITDFSGKEEDGGISNFRSQRKRDEAKKEAALLAGYTYIEVPYTDIKDLNDEYIWNLYKNNENKVNGSVFQTRDKLKPYYNREAREEYLDSDKHKDMLNKARQIRHQQYLRAKEKRKNGFGQ